MVLLRTHQEASHCQTSEIVHKKNKMKSALIFLSIIFLSCNNIYEGELYFKNVRLIPTEGFSKNEIDKIDKLISKKRIDINSNEIELYDYFYLLHKNNLLSKKNIYLKIDSKIIQVFISDEEFLKIKKYKLKELINNHKKLKLKLKLSKISENIFYCNKIISVEEIEGITSWEK